MSRRLSRGAEEDFRRETEDTKGKDMKTTIYFLLLTSYFILLSGCRREDVREMTVSMPALTEADKSKVVEALAKYNGVRKDSYVWDLQAKTLTLKYDSMQIAQANIRYAIDEKGVKVAFPEKTDDRAGY